MCLRYVSPVENLWVLQCLIDIFQTSLHTYSSTRLITVLCRTQVERQINPLFLLGTQRSGRAPFSHPHPSPLSLARIFLVSHVMNQRITTTVPTWRITRERKAKHTASGFCLVGRVSLGAGTTVDWHGILPISCSRVPGDLGSGFFLAASAFCIDGHQQMLLSSVRNPTARFQGFCRSVGEKVPDVYTCFCIFALPCFLASSSQSFDWPNCRYQSVIACNAIGNFVSIVCNLAR